MADAPNLLEDRFHILIARKIAGSIGPDEAEELELLYQAIPGLRLQGELLESMCCQEQQALVSEEAKEAYIRHLLKYRNDFINHEQGIEQHVPGTRQDGGRNSMGQTLHQNLPGRLTGGSIEWKKYFSVVAAFILVPLAIWLLMPGAPGEVPPPVQTPELAKEVAVKNGERQHLVLPDGSQVWLNAGSTLQYYAETFGGPRREVTLSGEAYFDIAHDEQRPFLVKSGHLQIRVLGTAFNVKAYPGEKEIETSLIRGSVEVTLDDRPKDVYILRPSEKLVVSNESPALMQQVAARVSQTEESVPLISLRKITVADSGRLVHETAWVQNKLVFRAESFASLAPRLERWYGVKFHFRNQSREALAFTGIFTTETISQALQAMQLVQPFEFIQENENIYIQ